MTGPLAAKSNFSPQDFKWETSAENLWDDELSDLGDLEPPRRNNDDDSSSYYAVSNTSGLPIQEEALPESIPKELSPNDEADEKAELGSLLDELHIGDSVRARLSDANNPLKFWISLRLQKHKDKTISLHEKLK